MANYTLIQQGTSVLVTRFTDHDGEEEMQFLVLDNTSMSDLRMDTFFRYPYTSKGLFDNRSNSFSNYDLFDYSHHGEVTESDCFEGTFVKTF